MKELVLAVCMAPCVALAKENSIDLGEEVNVMDAKFAHEFKICNSQKLGDVGGMSMWRFDYTPKDETPTEDEIYYCVTMDKLVVSTGFRHVFSFPNPGSKGYDDGIRIASKKAADDFALIEMMTGKGKKLKSRSQALKDADSALRGGNVGESSVVQLALTRHIASKCKDAVEVVYLDKDTEWTISAVVTRKPGGKESAFVVTASRSASL